MSTSSKRPRLVEVGDCLDANDAVQYADRLLSEDARQSVETHIARCTPCRLLVSELARSTADAGSAAAHAAPQPLSEDRYDLHGELGRGGIGRVVRAVDRRLRRPVALKELIAQHSGNRERFEREGQITARLQHPGVVPVYDAGSWESGEPYYSMKLVAGRTLQEELARARSLAERLSYLPNLLAVAETIAYAHNQGIVHRDITPSNIILGDFGETLVIDWGLAKDLAETGAEPPIDTGHPFRVHDAGLTVAGTVLGTPAYMPPEQGLGHKVRKTADVYAIGAVLYEIVSGRPPYRASSSTRALAQLAKGEPPPIQVERTGVVPDLLPIIAKAMARDPDDRYPSARELADDLRRLQTGQLVGARDYSLWTLIQRWMRRHRTVLTLAAIFLVVVAAIAANSVQRIAHERTIATQRANALRLAQATSALDVDPTTTLAWLRQHRSDVTTQPRATALASAAVEHGAAWRVFRADGRPFVAAAMAPDGRWIASLGDDRNLWRWDLDSGRARLLGTHDAGPWIARISGDGRWIASASDGSGLLLTNVEDEQSRRWLEPAAAVSEFCFLGQHSKLAVGTADGRLILVDPASGRSRPLGRAAGAAVTPEPSPAGDRLVTSSPDGTLMLWSVETGASRQLERHHGALSYATFSYDGRWVVSAGDDILLHPVAGTKETRRIPSVDGALYVGYLLAGDRLVTISVSGVIRVWKLQGLDSVVLTKQAAKARMIVSPSGSTVAYATVDGTVHVWDAASGRTSGFAGHHGYVRHLSFSADESYLTSAGDDGLVRVWKLGATGRIALSHPTEITGVALLHSGVDLASITADGTVRRWASTGTQLQALDGELDRITAFASSPVDGQLAAGTQDGLIGLWDLSSESYLLLGDEGSKIKNAIFSWDGAWIATAGISGSIRVWDPANRKGRLLGHHRDQALRLAVSPDSRLLASADIRGNIMLWDLAAGTSRALSGHGSHVGGLAFHPNGDLLASVSWDRTVRLWPLSGGEPRVLTNHTESVTRVAISRDGRYMLSAEAGGAALLWDAREWRVLRRLEGHTDFISAVAFAPDSKLVATADKRGLVRVWDVTTGDTAAFRDGTAVVDQLAFTKRSRLLATRGNAVHVYSGLRALLVPAHRTAFRAWLDRTTNAEIDPADQLTGGSTPDAP